MAISMSPVGNATKFRSFHVGWNNAMEIIKITLHKLWMDSRMRVPFYGANKPHRHRTIGWQRRHKEIPSVSQLTWNTIECDTVTRARERCDHGCTFDRLHRDSICYGLTVDARSVPCGLCWLCECAFLANSIRRYYIMGNMIVGPASQPSNQS